MTTSQRSDGGFHRVWTRSVPVDKRSIVLFRLGEACNNACPFCSNSGDPSLRLIGAAELLDRVDYLASRGVRRVMVTGGEPTIHPAFELVTQRLAARGMRWDLNTHGRTFARQGLSKQSVHNGLRRAIVSLHHCDDRLSAMLFGASESAHVETVKGIEALLRAGVRVMVNCVLSRHNINDLEAFVDFCVSRFATAGPLAIKFAFPTTSGKGGAWPGIALRYAHIRAPLERLTRRRADWPTPIYFENIPTCIVGDARVEPMNRTGFGQTHYLDDFQGRSLLDMRRIEARWSAFGPDCDRCEQLSRCSGVSGDYAAAHGYEELLPFPPTDRGGTPDEHFDTTKHAVGSRSPSDGPSPGAP